MYLPTYDNTVLDSASVGSQTFGNLSREMDPLVVKISDGELRGCKMTNLDGDEFISFRGIPYGKPAIGKLRFKAPQPVEPWTGVKDATTEANISYQNNYIPGNCSEDCLNLNVFTKELPTQNSQLKPVMVWIHGGAFTMGSSTLDQTGPHHLMTEDIVFVTVHYRLGFLGFLKLEDPSLGVPGNAGLKDQALGLKWVQKNIKAFGGDPNNVTLFGGSAGGVSVHYHVISQHSRGLFHKAIIQSGAVLNPWACGRQHDEFIKSLGVTSEKEALEILQNLSPEEVFQKQTEFVDERFGIIAPVIEYPNDTEFLTRLPVDIISSGDYNKVPIIMGYSACEGLLFVGLLILCRSTTNLTRNKNPRWEDLEDFIASYMKVDKGSETCTAICKKLADFYFQGENAADKSLFPADYHFIAGIIGSAKMHANTSQHPVYLYRITIDGDLNSIKMFLGLKDYPGTCHGDELGYLFSNPSIKVEEKDKTAVKRFVKLWTNFAKYGNPTPAKNDLGIRWIPVEKDNVHFLDIGDELTLHVDPEPERMRVWKEAFQLSPHTRKYLN